MQKGSLVMVVDMTAELEQDQNVRIEN